jgi:hypothetical protein
MRFITPAVAVLLCLLICAPAQAWSHKEHIMFTRIAVMRLLADPSTPPAMKDWLRDASQGQLFSSMDDARDYFMTVKIGMTPKGFRGLSYWVYQPDMRSLYDKADVKIAPFGVHEKFLHYIDLELFIRGDDVKREYKHDLSNKSKVSDIPHDMHDPRFVQAGMLPFRVEQCYAELVKAIREKRFTAPTLEAQEEKTAIYWAAYLAHYLADNTQPQHATMDYKSQSYFANKTRSPNVHAEVEYRMCDDEVNDFMDLRKEYWPLFAKDIDEFKDPVQAKDLFQATLEVSSRSYDALPLIGLAAMKAAKQAGTPEKPAGPFQPVNTEEFFHFKGQYMGREMTVTQMKAIQTAWATQRIQKILRQAWDEAMVKP